MWPGLTSLPDYNKISFPPAKPLSWSTLLPDASPSTIDLARQFLNYDSEKRISAEKVVCCICNVYIAYVFLTNLFWIIRQLPDKH